MITCQHCHTQTDDGAIFCDVCGHELAPAAQREGPREGQTPQPPPNARRPTAIPVATPGARPASPAQANPGLRSVPRASSGPPPAAIILRLTNGQRFKLRGKSDYTIGRLGADGVQPDVDLANFYGFEAGVSREHVTIHVRPDGVFVEDRESRNETVHNGYRLLPQQWYPLHEGDELRLGAIVLYVSFER